MFFRKKPSYKELEKKIRKLEQVEKDSAVIQDRLANVMKITRIGYWEHDILDGAFTLNDDVYRIFRTTVEKVGGYTLPSADFLRRFFHPGDISFLQSEMEKTIEMGSSCAGFHIEARILRGDGTTGYLVIRYLNVKMENGQAVLSLGVVQDITERKEVETQLQAITDSARDAILMLDPRGKIQYWNPAAEEILGYTANEALGKNLHHLLAPERSHPTHLNAFEQFIRSGTGDAVGKTLELYALRNGGLEIPVELSLSSVSLHGEWHAVGILRDISARKKTEAAILEGEKRFRDLAEMLPEVVFETDMDMNLTFVNRRALETFGYSRDDFKKGLTALDVLSPDNVEGGRENILKRLQGKLSGAKEYVGQKKDGSTFPMHLHASPILSKGTPMGLRGVVVDLTERKKFEKQLLQDQKMKSIGTLAGGIAHDFNNILQPLLGYCEFLKSETPADSPQRGYVEGILKSGLRAKDLVNQILTFSRQSEQEKTPVQVQQVLKEAVKLARSTIPANIQIQQDIQSDPVYIMADSTQMHQILMNLIINAYHAVAEIGGRISIHLVSAELDKADLDEISIQPGGYALLSVSDTGCGIEPAIMDKIFEPYFTTRSREEGSGLGLAVVYGIVKTHGGDIKINSEVGKGTTVHIYLPLTDKPSETASPGAEKKYPTGSERILFVDDEEIVAEVGGMMLERLGYQVTRYTSSIDALEAFKADPNAFDLVISDMAMPHMTGDQLSRELLALRPGMPIIICTGYSERFGQGDASGIGVNEFLMKPISISDLSQKIRDALNGISSQP